MGPRSRSVNSIVIIVALASGMLLLLADRFFGDEHEERLGVAGASESVGPAGGEAIAGYEVVSAGFVVPPHSTRTGSARCPAGKMVLGGGATQASKDGLRALELVEKVSIVESVPVITGDNGPGWVVSVRNEGLLAGDVNVMVSAVCATPLGGWFSRASLGRGPAPLGGARR